MNKQEDWIFHRWLTILFWSAVFFFTLKELKQAAWEDFAGAWSGFNVITYGILHVMAKKERKLPARMSFFKMVPYYLLSLALLVRSIIRYNIEQDWISIALFSLLCIIIVAREYIYSTVEM